MAANATPRFTATSSMGTPKNVDAANTNSDGTGNITTGPTMYLVYTGGANGSFLEFVRIYVTASAASTAAAATTIRLYLSTISANATTNADTHLIAEIAIPALTADVSGTALNPFDVPIGFSIPSGVNLLASSHVAANANTHYKVTCIGGDY